MDRRGREGEVVYATCYRQINSTIVNNIAFTFTINNADIGSVMYFTFRFFELAPHSQLTKYPLLTLSHYSIQCLCIDSIPTYFSCHLFQGHYTSRCILIQLWERQFSCHLL